jgi:putative ABC transport system permease protein
MNLLATLRVAVRAILRNKLRSFLTALGIIIGVAAVIAMVAVGEGAKAQVAKTFASMGSNVIMVMPGSSSAGGARGGWGSQPTLTWDDLAAITQECAAVRYAAPVLRSGGTVVGDDLNWSTQIQGTTTDFFRIRTWKAAQGTLFTDADVESGAQVCVLGTTVAEKIFPPGVDPVGRTVRLRNVPCEVVGVLERKGQSPMGQDFDDAVFMPLKAFRTRIQGGLQKYLNGTIMLSALDADSATRAETQVRGLLRDRHRIEPGTDDDFQVRNFTEIANAQQAGAQTFTMLLAAIALVSLVVGGIGIMNIMLVSVTERTREIGLRMAVGATPGQILAQFLIEALVLSVAGGLIGLAVGIGTAEFLGARFGWPILISPTVAVLAIGFSGLVGVVFGLYPANRAAGLDPIEALRYE